MAEDANYGAGSATANFNIDKAALTLRADDKNREVGAVNPAFTITYAGFVGGQGPAILVNPPVLSCLADVSSPAGSYAISLVGGSDRNYTFNRVSGLLTVTPSSTTGPALLAANFDDILNLPSDTQYQTGLPIVSGASPAGWDKQGLDAVWLVNYGTTSANWAVMMPAGNNMTLTSGIDANDLGVAYRVSFDLGAAVGHDAKTATQTSDMLALRIIDVGNDWVAQTEMAPGAWTGTQTFNRRSFTYLGNGTGPVRLRVESSAGATSSAIFVGAIDNISITPFASNLISGSSKITATTGISLNRGIGAIQQIVDGLDVNMDGPGGFGPNASTGIITLTFDQAYDLTSFLLSNGINGSGDGVASFNLIFLQQRRQRPLAERWTECGQWGGHGPRIQFLQPDFGGQARGFGDCGCLFDQNRDPGGRFSPGRQCRLGFQDHSHGHGQ